MHGVSLHSGQAALPVGYSGVRHLLRRMQNEARAFVSYMFDREPATSLPAATAVTSFLTNSLGETSD
jgi:hypothetical protein